MWISRVRIEYANIQIGDITYSNVNIILSKE